MTDDDLEKVLDILRGSARHHLAVRGFVFPMVLTFDDDGILVAPIEAFNPDQPDAAADVRRALEAAVGRGAGAVAVAAFAWITAEGTSVWQIRGADAEATEPRQEVLRLEAASAESEAVRAYALVRAGGDVRLGEEVVRASTGLSALTASLPWAPCDHDARREGA